MNYISNGDNILILNYCLAKFMDEVFVRHSANANFNSYYVLNDSQHLMFVRHCNNLSFFASLRT